MKKLLALALASLLTLSAFAGCGKEKGGAGNGESTENYQSVDINVAGLKGPTGIGMVRLMERSDAGEAANKYTFSLASAPTELVGKISSGEVDIAAVPTNLAATLYQKTNGGVKLLAVNTLGVLYLLEKGDSIHSVADLKGKTIYASGQGSTTEYVLNYLLEQAGRTSPCCPSPLSPPSPLKTPTCGWPWTSPSSGRRPPATRSCPWAVSSSAPHFWSKTPRQSRSFWRSTRPRPSTPPPTWRRPPR